MPPGPDGDRLTGNLAAFDADPLGFLTRCVGEYGDVVRLGSQNVLVAHPDDVDAVLVDRAGRFAKLSPDIRRRTRRPGFPLAMMNSDGPTWRAKRDRIAGGFTRALAGRAADLALAEAAAILDDLPTGIVFDPTLTVSRLTLRTVSRLMLGEAMADADVAMVGRLTESIMDASLSPIALPEWLPTPATRRMRRALRGMDEVVARIPTDPSDEAPVLAALLSAGPVPPAELRDELATLVLSGFETTKNAVLWTLDLLARAPEHAEAVAAQAQAAAGRTGTQLLEALPLAGAALREAMRLFPPGWLTSRESTAPCEVGGFTIAAGTTVTVSQWVTQRDRRWFDTPEEFRPQRWLGPDAVRPPRGAYFPFALGPRACIGAASATAEATVLISEVLRRFRLTPGPPVVPRPALSLQPAGLRLTLHPRRATVAA